MKANRKILIWGAAALVLAGLGVLAWFLIPGLRASSLDYAPTDAPPTAAGYWPTDGWRTSTPEEQGFDSAKLAEGLQKLHDKHIAIDSLLIIRNGYVILDAYFYPYEASYPHDLASVTKSITTTLVAIAAGQGKINLDQPMVSYFPDRVIANLDERKQSITVRNLAGMVNGMKSGCINGDAVPNRLDTGCPGPEDEQSTGEGFLLRQPGYAHPLRHPAGDNRDDRA